MDLPPYSHAFFISIPYSDPSIAGFPPAPQFFCYILFLSVGYANINTTFSAFLSPEFKRANASLHSSGKNSLVMTVSKL